MVLSRDSQVMSPSGSGTFPSSTGLDALDLGARPAANARRVKDPSSCQARTMGQPSARCRCES
jgi:hypothetical protein